MILYKYSIVALVISVFLLFYACNDYSGTKQAVYAVTPNCAATALFIDEWNITGPFTSKRDSILAIEGVYGGVKSQLTANPDTTVKLWHNGVHHPQYGQLDLREVFGIGVNDTTKVLDSLIIYLSCTIRTEHDVNMFLHVNTEMTCQQYVNGDSLIRIEGKEPELYRVHLKAGDNTLTVRAQGAGKGYWYEATLYDMESAAQLYAEQHTGNIIYPVISRDSVLLTDAHWSVTDAPVKLILHDVNGTEVTETVLEKGIMTYCVPDIQPDRTFICSMVMQGDTVRQPVMSYAMEDVEEKFKALRDSLPDNHPRADEIDQLIYRLWKLNSITGKMREDAWYPFKFPWVAYQLEHTFAHLDGTYGNDDNENNFKFITYRSRLDGCLQRYLLITPNTVDRNRKYPLVVIARPCSENRYHLFFSPQISHQFVVNDMQAVANKYGVFVILPEARMMLNEDMMPFAEAEMRQALEDVQEHYNIDKDRIFLHANCSGGYRALIFATQNPDMFAGIALYAPVYKKNGDNVDKAYAPETMLKNLRNTPILIYGDPVDTHSPVKVYVDLIKDCEKYGIPCQVTFRRNSGLGYHGYHRLIVGRAACEFFKDKHRAPRVIGHYKFPPNNTTVADFYSRPFIYVYNAADTSAVYKDLVRSIRDEYETYLYARLPLDKDVLPKMPLIPDTRVTRTMLAENNVFLVGGDFENNHVRQFVDKVRKGAAQCGKGQVCLVVHDHPNDKHGMVLMYISGNGSHFKHIIYYPWKNGFSSVITVSENQTSK